MVDQEKIVNKLSQAFDKRNAEILTVLEKTVILKLLDNIAKIFCAYGIPGENTHYKEFFLSLAANITRTNNIPIEENLSHGVKDFIATPSINQEAFSSYIKELMEKTNGIS